MPRRPASVTQADIARAIRALQATGVNSVRVVLREGSVIVEAADDPRDAAELPSCAEPERIVPL